MLVGYKRLRVSLRLILIEDDDGLGQNVKPLAQASILHTYMEEGDDPIDFVNACAKASQEGIFKELSARHRLARREDER